MKKKSSLQTIFGECNANDTKYIVIKYQVLSNFNVVAPCRRAIMRSMSVAITCFFQMCSKCSIISLNARVYRINLAAMMHQIPILQNSILKICLAGLLVVLNVLESMCMYLWFWNWMWLTFAKQITRWFIWRVWGCRPKMTMSHYCRRSQ